MEVVIERPALAQEFRSRGNELAEGIRADADRQRTVILAEAFARAEEMRGEGDAEAARLVTGLLMAYGFGMPAYLGRDLLVRVFYALGDGATPFRVTGCMRVGAFVDNFLPPMSMR